MILEQGLEVDEPVEDQPRTRGTRRVRWASIATHRRFSMEGCCATPSSEISDGGGVAARGEVIVLRKLEITAAAEVLRREHDRGQRVWWEANATHPWRSRDAVAHHRRNALTIRGRRQDRSWAREQQPEKQQLEVLRWEYCRGQWRSKSFGGSIAVGNGEQIPTAGA